MESPVTVIVCPSCGHQNEPSRVFCHNCGVRLPREEAVVEQVEETNRAATSTANTLRRGKIQPARRQIDWQELLASAIASTVKLAILAAIVAALILVFRVPAGLPGAFPHDLNFVERGDTQLDRMTDSASTGTINATSDQLNTYLQTKISTSSEIPVFRLKSSNSCLFIKLENQEFTLGNQFEVLGFPLVLQTRFVLESPSSGNASLRIEGGSLGSLPLPSWVFQKALRWFDPVGEVLAPQLGTLARAKDIKITPEGAKVTW